MKRDGAYLNISTRQRNDQSLELDVWVHRCNLIFDSRSNSDQTTLQVKLKRHDV